MQAPLWYDSFEDALRDAVVAIGGVKRVAGDLWPDKTQEQATRLLNACLDVERPEKFEPSQIMFIWRRSAQSGCHVLAAYVGQEANYTFQPISPEDKKSELQKQFINAVAVVQNLGKALGVAA